MKRSENYIFLYILALVLTLTCSCDKQEEAKQVSLTEYDVTAKRVNADNSDKSLRIAISAMISPEETFLSYRKILDYIGDKFGSPVNLVQRETYAEVNELVRKEELEAAFVCTGAYTSGHKDFGMELLVAPVAYGRPVYYSYIIVPASSKIENLAELRGKRFAFTDPLSNTGKLAPTYMLARMNENPDNFFEKHIYTYSHDNSIKAVANNLVDGAAVDSLVWDYLNAKKSSHTAATKVIKKSIPYGIPPVVVPKNLDSNVKVKLKNIFLKMHDDPEGKKILADIMIDKFIEVDDQIYDSVREMDKWLNESNKLPETK